MNSVDVSAPPAHDAETVFEQLSPADKHPIDRSVVIVDGVRRLAQWSLRLLLICAAAYVSWFLLKKVWEGVLPIILALIICTVLWPPVAALRKIGLPAGFAAFSVILSSIAFLGGIIYFIAPDVVRQSQIVYHQAFEGIQRAQSWLQGPPFNLDDDKMAERLNSAIQWLQNKSGKIASEIYSGIGIATSVLITAGIVLVLTFFFLKDGDKFLPWLRRITGQRVGWHLTEVLFRVWNTLSGFIRAQAIVSLVDAFFIGLGLYILGVPMAFTLTVLTFIAGFIPILGAVVAGALAVLVALVSLGLTKAIITLIIVLAVQQLEGNVLSPILQSRAMNLHPAIILLSVTIGSSLFDIVGAFLAVPVAATIAVFLHYIEDMIALRSGEKTAEQINFVTTAGTLTAKEGEELGRKFRLQFLANLSGNHTTNTVGSEPQSDPEDPQKEDHEDVHDHKTDSAISSRRRSSYTYRALQKLSSIIDPDKK
ncbi:AI-2E family transporter [Corynebacterium sp. sy017]|uniref:AI-2E family transporter n=1 Tax=unclassified Corynebacterium TaxID=2624378 RepID=UPI001186EB5B|nr:MULTISPECIES: AI-2E family transporter [unclassified Corynebacterium]MBP3088926.1 AI-2E family transporter [Corynebacterium sp. sy017]QDZ43507.1 AI-2E family transporter [Corynebacterium sp. sy039]TSD91520.1 AI-2E family transporter [Corynebacterium sp. SY003]